MNRLPPFAPFGSTPQRAFILLAAVLISPMALLATTSMLGTRPTEPASTSSSDHVGTEGRRMSGVITGSGNAAAPSGRTLTLVPPVPTTGSDVDGVVAAAGPVVAVRPSLPSPAVQSALIGGAALAGLLVGIALARADRPQQ